MKNKLKISIYSLFVFLLLFYGYSRSFQHYAVIKLIARFGIYTFIMFAALEIIRYRKKLSLLDVSFLLSAAVPLMSLIGKDYNHAQFAETRSWTIIYVAAILFIIAFKNNQKMCDKAILIIKKYSVFYVFFTYLFFFVPSLFTKVAIKFFNSSIQPYVLRTFNNGNMPGLTAHYSTNGIYLSIACCWFFGLLLTKVHDCVANKIDYFLMIVVLGALGLTGKRGPFIMAIFAMFLVFYIYYSNRPKKRIQKIIEIIIISIMGIAIISLVFPSMLNSVNRILQYASKDNDVDVTAGRLVLYQHAIQMFLENPVTGKGWARFRQDSYSLASSIGQANNGTSLQAHNVFLQLLAESGIVGTIITLLPFVIVTIKCISSFYKSRKKNLGFSNSSIMLFSVGLCYQIFFWIYCLTGNPFYDTTCLFIFTISLTFSITAVNQVNKENYYWK